MVIRMRTVLRVHGPHEAALQASQNGAGDDEEGEDAEAGPGDGDDGGEEAAAEEVPAGVEVGPVGLGVGQWVRGG